MPPIPQKLQNKLQQRVDSQTLRQLGSLNTKIDFYSNDYLGLAQSELIFNQTHDFLRQKQLLVNGSSGSRLISGEHVLFSEAETKLKTLHKADAALLFNSGYDANLSLLSCVPQKDDLVLFDKLSHASLRDGIQLSQAKSAAFKHNCLIDLEKKLLKHLQKPNCEIYVVTESVFSMDGDSPDLSAMIELVEKHNAHLIVDEAHALGVFGYGLVQKHNLQHRCFARVMTFGKALGCHGAVILGSESLKSYLVNFARPFIYTTAMSPFAVANIMVAYDFISDNTENTEQNVVQKSVQRAAQKIAQQLQSNIAIFRKLIHQHDIEENFIESRSAIQSCVISGNKKVKSIAEELNAKGFAIKAIYAPTVPQNQERIRICLHAFDDEKDIINLLECLSRAIKKYKDNKNL